MQQQITMFVIDQALRNPQCGRMLSHDELVSELRRQIAEKRFTQKALADHLNVAPSRINEVLTDKRRIQPHEMPIVAAWLGMEDEDEVPAAAKPIPFLGEVPAGNWREAVRKTSASMPSPDPSLPSSAFALRVSGDSMDLLVDDGATIIVDPTDLDLFPGRYYVVRNGDGETTFKQYQDRPARLVPCSTNPRHEEIPISGGRFEVIGRIIWRAARM